MVDCGWLYWDQKYRLDWVGDMRATLDWLLWEREANSLLFNSGDGRFSASVLAARSDFSTTRQHEET